MSVTHVAGISIGIKSVDLWIQRCALCGEVLQDLKPSRIFVPEGEDMKPPEFKVGGLYRITQGNPKSFIFLGDFAEIQRLPDDFCFSLLERQP